MKIVNSYEESGLLIKGVNKVKTKANLRIRIITLIISNEENGWYHENSQI